MWRDAAFLLDILNAARKVRRFTTGITEEEFEKNDLVQSAVMRQLGIPGEAARKVSQETRTAHPEIPWVEIIGMRNRVIHEYSQINLGKIWDTTQNDILYLITLIEPLVPPPEDG